MLMSLVYRMVDGVLQSETAEPSQPGPDEVLVEVEASSLNYRDIAIRAGFYPSRSGVIPLSDGAGKIVEVGAAVSDLKAGQQVTSCFYPFWESGPASATNHRATLGCDLDGMLTKFVTLPANAWIPTPKHMSSLEASTLPCAALTAWAALFNRADLLPGQHVLIQGTGGVAVFAIQFAKAMGARVTVISSSDEKLARAAELGSDIGVNYSEFPEWDERVIEEVGPEEIDLVIELGGAQTLQRSLNCLKVGGRVSMVGVLSGNEVSMNISAVLAKWIAIQGITVSHREDFVSMNRFLESKRIRPILDKVLPLSQVQAGYDELPRGRHFGKLVLDHLHE